MKRKVTIELEGHDGVEGLGMKLTFNPDITPNEMPDCVVYDVVEFFLNGIHEHFGDPNDVQVNGQKAPEVAQ